MGETACLEPLICGDWDGGNRACHLGERKEESTTSRGNRARAAEIEKYVREDRNYAWGPYDMGRWAFNRGMPAAHNPFADWHANRADWASGWHGEAGLHLHELGDESNLEKGKSDA